ncbi:MAG: hypothetical protein V2A62_02785 [Candidatus Woesearchaeota archaeon]
MDKPIILIGGTAGTGKTTLAQDLCSKLQIDHRLGTGFIREIIRSQTTPQQEPSLFEYTFRANDPIIHFVYQSERIYGAINACINRVKREGTSLIIEGNHLIPSLYSNLDVNLYLVLSAPDLETHMKQLQGTTHVTRILNSNDVQNIRCIGDYLKRECNRLSIPYLPYPRTINDILRLIK